MVIIVLMGVCGSGKSTVGSILSEKVGWPLVDADDYHPESNRHKMAQGIPLSDEDREDWLVTLNHILQSWQSHHQNGILACSALKRSYRDILCTGQTVASTQESQPRQQSMSNITSSETTDSTASSSVAAMKDVITFVHLKGTKESMCSRMSGRDGHFMPVELLDSQFETLEEPSPDEGRTVLTEDINQPVDDIASHIADFIAVYEHSEHFGQMEMRPCDTGF